jgi:hypothetical protein
MTTAIPPAPIRDPWGSYSWEDWFRSIRNRATESLTSVSWTGIDFTGSSLTSIVDRKHNDLSNIQGGTSAEYYHLTQAQNTSLTGLKTGTLDQTPTVSAATTTHKVPVTLNGNTYYILLSDT